MKIIIQANVGPQMKSQLYSLFLLLIFFFLFGCTITKVVVQPSYNITDIVTILHKDGNISYKDYKKSYYRIGKWQVFKVSIYVDSFENNKLVKAEEKDGYYLFDTTKVRGYLYFQNKLIDSIRRDSFLMSTMPAIERQFLHELYNKANNKHFLLQKKLLLLSYLPDTSDLFKVDTMKIYFDDKLLITEPQLNYCYELSEKYKNAITKIEFIYNRKIAKDGNRFPMRKDILELKRVDHWELDSTIAKRME